MHLIGHSICRSRYPTAVQEHLEEKALFLNSPTQRLDANLVSPVRPPSILTVDQNASFATLRCAVVEMLVFAR